MSINGLQWQTVNIPLAAGLMQRGDARAGNPPTLDICTNAQFDETGGIQLRHPYGTNGTLSSDIFGGGTLTDVRKMYQNGSELICFTKTGLYAFDSQTNTWHLRGEHLAAKIDETPRFKTAKDQIECDRAELDGTIVYAWTETFETLYNAYVAAVDKATGAVKMAPTLVSGEHRPKLIALDTKIVLMTIGHPGLTLNGLLARALDPSNPAAGVAAAPIQFIPAADAGDNYDAVRIIGLNEVAFALRRTGSGSYYVGQFDETLTGNAEQKVRSCSGPIAISSSPDGFLQIVRNSSSNVVQGDLLSTWTGTTFTDVFTNQALGSATHSVKQIAACHRSVADSGFYRCYVFISDGEVSISNVSTAGTRWNWVDTNGTINTSGSAPIFRNQLGVASRAFDHEGRVFVNLVFACTTHVETTSTTSVGAEQNTFFLYRDDAFLVGKTLYNKAGGYHVSNGHLPNVAAVDGGYAWLAIDRRLYESDLLGTGFAYGDRGPVDVLIAFDSDDSRRVTRIGETLYISCAEGLLQYDGVELTESGFHYYPYYFTGEDSGGAGNIPNGNYSYLLTYRSVNAKGESQRSAPVASIIVDVTLGPARVELTNISTLIPTHKNVVAIEVWRTVVNPPAGAPYYLATDSDPSNGLGDNCWLQNDSNDAKVDWFDNLSDEDLRNREQLDISSLEDLPPPSGTISASNADRVFVAGIPGSPNTVWYSKLRVDGSTAGFHDTLKFTVPDKGGPITAISFLMDTVLVFTERCAYAFGGDGFLNDGTSGANYGPARTLSEDVGAINPEGVLVIVQGCLFKSLKGWHMVDRGWNVSYVGAPISDFDDETIIASHTVTKQHQARIMSAERVLVFDYLVNQWSTWSIQGGLGASMLNGVYHVLTPSGPAAELESYATADYGLDIETPWIKMTDGLQGWARVRRMLVLGEFQSAHSLRIRIARDYKATATDVWDYFDDQIWTTTPTVVGGPMQLRIGPSQQQCQAIKLRITVYGPDGGLPSGESLKLTGLAIEVGAKRGVFVNLPAAQKT